MPQRPGNLRLCAVALAVACAPAALAACTGGGAVRHADVGRPATTSPSPVPIDGVAFASGDNGYGQLGTGDHEPQRSLRPVSGPFGASRLDGIVSVAAGLRHTIAVRADGSVVAWGANNDGQLGDGTRRPSPLPVRVRAPDGRPGWLTGAIAVAADSDFSMALLRGGTVVTWGSADAGQRGIGATPPPLAPSTVRAPRGNGPLRGARAIRADGRSELALLADGTVVGWGDNSFGQLGDGTYQLRNRPVFVHGLYGAPRLTGVRDIAMGGQHALAVLVDGRVLSWGSNSRGQLGDSSRGQRPFPDVVTGVDGDGVLDGVTSVCAAELSSMALLGDGTAVGWGDDTAGQLGNGVRTSYQPAPTFVLPGERHEPLRGLRAIYCGEAYGYAVTSAGALLSWGAGSKGQLAAGPLVTRTRPGPVPLPRTGAVVSVGTGMRHVVVVLATP
ncbi:MAG: RCC1 domain-containing protein [Frankiaceae bacterium]